MAATYLDANATEPLRPLARAAVLACLETVGNPSSVHGFGRTARRMLEDARADVAGRFGVAAEDVVFTSGGTEANTQAILGLAPGRRILAGATEHPAVIAAAGPGAFAIPVRPDGTADLDALDAALSIGGPALVCLMLANNETGVLHPIAAVSELCQKHDARLHVDAVQMAGRIALDVAALGADTVAVSSHKLGGPMGAGALMLCSDAARGMAPLMTGGGQERGRRGGTPNLPAIAGFAAAASVPPEQGRLAKLRDAAEQAALACGAVVIGAGAARLANTTCLALPGVAAMTQVIALDLEGVAVSAGAACSSGKVTRSHVLDAMGQGALAGAAIRVSLPWNATEADVAAFATAYQGMAARVARHAA